MSLDVGLCTHMTDAGAILDRCRELDVSQVTLQASTMPGYGELGHPDPTAFRELYGRLSDEGITVAAIMKWIGDFAELALDPDSHRKQIDGALKLLEMQGEYGIDRQLHYVDLPEPEDPADDDAMWDGMLGIYRELIAQAESSGVRLANHAIWRCLPLDMRDQALADGVTADDYRQYRPEGWAGPYLVRTADHIRRIIDSVPSDSNGLAMCTGMYITGAEPLEEVGKFAGRINYVQIRDLDARWPAAREVFPGTGNLDFPAILRALIDAGYSGFLHPEHLGQPRFDGDDLEKDATRLVKEWVAEAESAS